MNLFLQFLQRKKFNLFIQKDEQNIYTSIVEFFLVKVGLFSLLINNDKELYII